jgi:serine/threonine protein kinase
MPSTMGRYSAIASLGQGGMANVYLALMSGLGGFKKLLVLKVLREDLDVNRDELATMFLDEARLAAHLHHRNIVQTNEFGELDGHYYMAMEYLEGKTLRALQHMAVRLPLADELHILAETARGLHYAHELVGLNGEPLSVVHRDVSPQNVFVTYDGQVKLLDFGIAKMAGAEHLTQVGVIKGKVDYIAPEQVRGDPVDRRADVFSLGAMLWEAITGERFGGRKVPEVTRFHNRLTGGEAKVRALKPDVPEALAAIVDEAIALDPSVRTPSAAAFADQIESYLATLPSQPSERSLAAALSAPFQEERTELRKVIDRQCKKIIETASSAQRAGLDLGLVRAGAPDLSGPGTGSNTREGLPASVERTLPGRGVTKWRRAALLGGPGVAIVVAVLLGFYGQTQDTKAGAGTNGSQWIAPDPAVAPKTAPSEARDPAPASAIQESVRLAVEVSPREAQVLLDGVPLPGMPFSGTFQKSGALHRLEASADGYQAAKQFVTFDQDRRLEIRLQPLPAPTRARGKRTPASKEELVRSEPKDPATSQKPSDAQDDVTPAPPKSKASNRGFDMQDPYAE